MMNQFSKAWVDLTKYMAHNAVIGNNGRVKMAEHLVVHGHRRRDSTTAVYKTWLSMLARCRDQENHNYGGRGVSVCDSWLDFTAFYSDMGDRPEGHTIDRINPEEGYSKENCRWATARAQALNKRGSVYSTHGVDLVSLSEDYGIPLTTIYRRFNQGYRGAELVDPKSKLTLRVGEKCASAKLNCESVKIIKKMLKSGETQRLIAKRFGVSQPVISEIKSGKAWAHVK